MSALMRNVIDQVLRNMGEEERAQSVNYVTDRMVERMDNQERVALLLAILDRVMSNLSSDERVALAEQVARRLSGSERAAAAVGAVAAAEAESPAGARESGTADPA